MALQLICGETVYHHCLGMASGHVVEHNTKIMLSMVGEHDANRLKWNFSPFYIKPSATPLVYSN